MLQKIKRRKEKEKWWCLFCCWCKNNKSQVSLSFSFIFTLNTNVMLWWTDHFSRVFFSACSMSCWDRLQHPHDPIWKKLQTLANSTLAFHTNVQTICLWIALFKSKRHFKFHYTTDLWLSIKFTAHSWHWAIYSQSLHWYISARQINWLLLGHF